jgi:hypothetical protein
MRFHVDSITYLVVYSLRWMNWPMKRNACRVQGIYEPVKIVRAANTDRETIRKRGLTGYHHQAFQDICDIGRA